MNLKEIKEIINLMNENNLMELEIEKEGMSIRLKKTSGNIENLSSQVILERGKITEVPKNTPADEVTEKLKTNTIEIKAPMVGTFYRAPAPEAPAYVEAGQTIEPGQVICIIEAMKLMNEIKSEIKGKIIEIIVDTAEPVEFGQPMFLIEPL